MMNYFFVFILVNYLKIKAYIKVFLILFSPNNINKKTNIITTNYCLPLFIVVFFYFNLYFINLSCIFCKNKIYS